MKKIKILFFLGLFALSLTSFVSSHTMATDSASVVSKVNYDALFSDEQVDSITNSQYGICSPDSELVIGLANVALNAVADINGPPVVGSVPNTIIHTAVMFIIGFAFREIKSFFKTRKLLKRDASRPPNAS